MCMNLLIWGEILHVGNVLRSSKKILKASFCFRNLLTYKHIKIVSREL
jgi:hypothetical protein